MTVTSSPPLARGGARFALRAAAAAAAATLLDRGAHGGLDLAQVNVAAAGFWFA
eukprot:CAMPEP_0118869932 /NCGR_PEP_ID=MMETSP1163-20130328/13049_1 /TAXON_ID=124430 /ORGANISM="Phaeomonas parva, Strain CCMP2877" /LENGTH=53 /DNA_ID=CAMNT_0006804871 /DNA_START=318 /DNA_END=480 /DNA_ORIENTATION=+